MAKSQFTSTEDLNVTLPPFTDKTSHDPITAGDSVTLTIKKPDGTLLASPPTPARDADTDFWVASVPSAEFQEGTWLVKGVSDDANAIPQYLILVWGDYVDDIQEARQAALGRWKIEGTQLKLYEEDGSTVFKTFDLKDENGDATSTRVFERDPV